MSRQRTLRFGVLSVLVLCAHGAHAQLRVAATTPDLADLARSVGGDDVEVTAFVRGAQDPHFLEPRPSFIRVLSKSDVFVTTGLSLEIGWVPALIQKARNARIRPSAPGAVDASRFISPLGAASGAVDRSMGDVHARGNPHYCADPIGGLRVARGLRDRFSALDPANSAAFAQRYAVFEAKLMSALLGDALGARATEAAAAAFAEHLDAWIAEAGEGQLAGWVGALRPYRGSLIVADHDLWPYFARRFGLKVVEFLEPKPGITPTTRHLAQVVARIERDGIRAILSSAYFHPRYARKVAAASGATLVEMANQVESRDGVEDYLSMIDWNVTQLVKALQ
jgi:ABC-type Zn uptake system ZnuABC Zn-binding protein ZnuA